MNLSSLVGMILLSTTLSFVSNADEVVDEHEETSFEESEIELLDDSDFSESEAILLYVEDSSVDSNDETQQDPQNLFCVFVLKKLEKSKEEVRKAKRCKFHSGGKVKRRRIPISEWPY